MLEIDLLLTAGNIYTLDANDTRYETGSIAINNGRIVAIGCSNELEEQYIAKEKINANGKYIFPGLINTHTHLFQTILKGFARDMNLNDWLNTVIRPYVPHINAEICYLSALVGCIEALHSGTTTILDYMYAHPRPYLSDAVLQAFEDVGIRGLLARGFSERLYGSNTTGGMAEKSEEFLADALRLRSKYGDRIWLAPTAIWNMTDAGLRMVRDFAQDYQIPITMHINETELDDVFCLEHYGQPALVYLEEMGFLKEHLLAVHCVHIDAAGATILKKYGVKISYNPVSNMILGSGALPLSLLKKYQLNVSLGTDGAASNDSLNMLETMKVAALLPKVIYHDPAVISAQDIVRMATIDGAKALGLGEEIGSLEPGKKADLIIYNPLQPQSFPMHDPLATLVYTSNPTNIDTVIINGKLVMANNRIVTLDEEKVLKEALIAVGQLIERV
ncbi:Melamine deaminase [Neomoorella glycerini]|uniref:Melamine deaminase n=1 Tax=Neomoorella glycerini TaxID=55779 RepID=A0A6I5ZS95_9FIRM|nr:amidohydrolase [Moorella glycerini]QGP92579.1 Melamine deaminase [Moorella glycerini]